MAGPSDAEIRRVLRANGVEVGGRGRLSADQHAAYEAIMDGHWTVTDPDAASGPEPVPGAGSGPQPPGPDAAEQRPRSVPRQSSAGAAARGWWRRRQDAGADSGTRARKTDNTRGGRSNRAGTRKPAPERPWLPTAGVIETVWSRLAWAASGIPPVQRILAAQAPMAGVVLQDKLKGTLTDRVILQPFARVEDQAEAFAAMVGVPAMVALISFRGKTVMVDTPQGPRPVIGDDGMPVWDEGTELMIAGLKFSLASWLAVSRRYADDVIAQAEESIRIGAEADRLIRWLFAPPDPSQSWADVQREAAEHAQSFTDAARPAPAADEPDGGAGGSAWRPALTGSVFPSGM